MAEEIDEPAPAGTMALSFDPILLLLLIGWLYYCLWSIPRYQRSRYLPNEIRPLAGVVGFVIGPLLYLAFYLFNRLDPNASAAATAEPPAVGGVKSRMAWLFGRLRQESPPPAPKSANELRLFDDAGRELNETYGSGADKEINQVVTLTREIIASAWQRRASDVLIDPTSESAFGVRFRIDGVLSSDRELDAETGRAVISSIKAVAGMDISDRRRPQDGSFSARRGADTASFRCATAGVHWGEKMSIRVLNRAAATFTLNHVGLTAKQGAWIRQTVQRPAGMIMVCGPTGSGKTTTLYAMINAIDRATRNVITVEDPVEAILPATSQISVNRKADITFAQALRNILRHDPDVICVGEIRDEETAEIGLRASQTGHLVIATIHCDSNAGAMIRLLDLGISPLLLTSGLSMLISQRLVRKLCPKCRQRIEPKASLLKEFEAERVRGRECFVAVGCNSCGGTGYRGRMAIADIFELSEEFKANVSKDPSLIARMRADGERQGVSSLRREGLKRVASGFTSLEEIDRVLG